MKLTEKNVENMLVMACRKMGLPCLKTERLARGFPDRKVFNRLHYETYYIEFKNETYYKQTRAQKKWQEIIEKSGGKYFLLDGEEETKKFIDKYIYRGEKK